jgi:hypothetical protein
MNNISSKHCFFKNNPYKGISQVVGAKILEMSIFKVEQLSDLRLIFACVLLAFW